MSPAIIAAIVAGSIFLLWVLINMKTSRPDGVFIKKLHPYRQILNYLMPTRNEAVVYFDAYARADKLLEYIDQINERFECNITHCYVAACARGLADNPKMNQFSVGRRVYERKGRFITFSLKRKKLNKEAKVSTVKLQMADGETFAQLCGRINDQINVERSDKKTYNDKEMDLFGLLPRAVMVRAVRLFKWFDYQNLLPWAFMKNDPFFTSIFAINLGSVKMAPGFHHLAEWGNCPLFGMLGKIEEKPVVENGKVVVRKMAHIRWSYDERIDDGLTARFGIEAVNRVLEDPFTYLGCLAEDGSDARSLSAPMDEVEPVQAEKRVKVV